MRPLLEVQGVRKAYAVRGHSGMLLPAVDGVDLALKAGETLGLVGESGCGKSTLARLILSLERPDEGRITFDGRDVLHLDRAGRREMKRGMQVVFQDPFGSLNPRRRVGASVAEPMRIHGTLKGARREARTRALFEMVGLTPDMMGRYPHEFSGGQRQRICIARALAVDPRLLVCDEPVSALDVSIQAQVINLLVDLQRELALAYIFISHDLAVVGYISDRVAVMYRGRIVELADTADIFADPLHPYTRCLMAAIPAADPAVSLAAGSGAREEPERVYPAGCPFASRCPSAGPECLQTRPDLVECKPGHLLACHGCGRS